VERFEVGGERRRGPAAGRSPKHLIAAVHQQSDFIAEHHTGFVDARVLAWAIFNHGANSVASDLRLARAGGAGAEAKLSQAIDAFGKSGFVRFLSAEEHAATIMAWRSHECERGTQECVRHGQGCRCFPRKSAAAW
jgi:hypothetical protein